MYRRLDDFTEDWAQESASTLRVLRALTDASLGQKVTPEGRSIGRLAWHITLTIPEMGRHAGLDVAGPQEDAPQPTSAAAIADTYQRAAAALPDAVRRAWRDEDLPGEIDMYGERWTRGAALSAFIRHEAHHRGQITVLMRQAGLSVPGVYGPSREEWAAFGMTAPE